MPSPWVWAIGGVVAEEHGPASWPSTARPFAHALGRRAKACSDPGKAEGPFPTMQEGAFLWAEEPSRLEWARGADGQMVSSDACCSKLAYSKIAEAQ